MARRREPRLREEIQQTRAFASAHEEAFLGLQRTAGLHHQALSTFLRPAGVTPTQYNALRILRGSAPAALTCSEVGERMVNPLPDVTRLMDRLEARGLVERSSDAGDRRRVRLAITSDGKALLAELDRPVSQWIEGTLGALTDGQISTLIRLLGLARA